MSGSASRFQNCGHLCWIFLLLSFIICFAFAFFIFMIIFQPQELKFTITEASLEEFNLAETNNNNTLSYNLALNVTIRNPNKKVGVFFDRVEAIAKYCQKRLISGPHVPNSIAPFYQGHKNTTIFRVVFEGRLLVTNFEDQSEIERYNFEKSSGIFSIDLKINVRMRAKYGKIKIGHFKHPKIDCKLKVPLLSNGTYSVSTQDFKATRCVHV